LDGVNLGEVESSHGVDLFACLFDDDGKRIFVQFLFVRWKWRLIALPVDDRMVLGSNIGFGGSLTPIRIKWEAKAAMNPLTDHNETPNLGIHKPPIVDSCVEGRINIT
jgi:hypothetical protein